MNTIATIPSEVTLLQRQHFRRKKRKPLEGYDVLVVKNIIMKIDRTSELQTPMKLM